MRVAKRTGIMDRKKTVFILIDVQEKFVPAMHGMEAVSRNVNMLTRASGILGIPLIVTEQYTKGLGKTAGGIHVPESAVKVEKTEFSCFDNREFREELKKTGASTLVIFGLEAHVCVLKTALDGIARGYEVHVVSDAVTSRTGKNHDIAIGRMRQSGIFMASAEMVLFQLMERAGNGEFSEISALVK